jgi:hypothetical protein
MLCLKGGVFVDLLVLQKVFQTYTGNIGPALGEAFFCE